jgi:LacI family transcriptional regulator
MLSIKDIAKEAGVSVSTVSRVINGSGYVSKEARKNVTLVIERLNFNPSTIARSLVRKKSKVIGLIVPYIDSPFFASFVEGVETEARQKEYDIFLCHTHEDTETEKKYIKLLIERRVDGIIATPVGREGSYFKELIKQIPIVFTVRSFEGIDIDSVTVDNIEESYKIVKYLIENGHKRIGIIKSTQEVITGRQRWKGVQKAFNEFNIVIDSSIIVESDYTASGGYKAAVEILNNPKIPTAIYAPNHLTSAGMLKAIKEKGMKVPNDISIAAFDGFDDTYAEDIISSPGITANCHPSRQIGQEAVKLLYEKIIIRENGKTIEPTTRNVILKMQFIDRGSVKSFVGFST